MFTCVTKIRFKLHCPHFSLLAAQSVYPLMTETSGTSHQTNTAICDTNSKKKTEDMQFNLTHNEHFNMKSCEISYTGPQLVKKGNITCMYATCKRSLKGQIK